MIESALTIEIMVIAVMFASLTMFFGYMAQGWMGSIILGLAASAVVLVCAVSIAIGSLIGQVPGAWAGLGIGIIVAVPVINLILGVFIGHKARWFVSLVWLGFAAIAIFGHLAGGWLGQLTITLPAIILFWVGLYRISNYTLPVRDKSQRGKAFRSLMTFSMGTNYPYYFVNKNGEVDERVKGNPYLQFFAGPGIVYTDCDHAAYVSDSVFKNRVFEPGLNFTDPFDLPPQIVDLRPQLRAFPVDAITKDGIHINVVTFIPFKIDTGNKALKLGQSFPTNHNAIQAAVTSGLIEKTGENNGDHKHEWDDQLVPLIATPIVQDVISRYNVDELCNLDDLQTRTTNGKSQSKTANGNQQAETTNGTVQTELVDGDSQTDKSNGDPRTEIAAEIIARITKALQPMGLKVIGGGISNLMPQDNIVLEKRLETWRTEWEGTILEQLGPEKHQYLLELDRVKTEADIIKRLADVAKQSNEQDMTRLIQTLDQIMEPSRRRR